MNAQKLWPKINPLFLSFLHWESCHSDREHDSHTQIFINVSWDHGTDEGGCGQVHDRETVSKCRGVPSLDGQQVHGPEHIIELQILGRRLTFLEESSSKSEAEAGSFLDFLVKKDFLVLPKNFLFFGEKDDA